MDREVSRRRMTGSGFAVMAVNFDGSNCVAIDVLLRNKDFD